MDLSPWMLKAISPTVNIVQMSRKVCLLPFYVEELPLKCLEMSMEKDQKTFPNLVCDPGATRLHFCTSGSLSGTCFSVFCGNSWTIFHVTVASGFEQILSISSMCLPGTETNTPSLCFHSRVSPDLHSQHVPIWFLLTASQWLSGGPEGMKLLAFCHERQMLGVTPGNQWA